MGDHVTVVGQGLAGTCLAWRLRERGVSFRILHQKNRRSASIISAGLVTPVTGKGMNPSWRIEEYLPGALSFYRGVEATLETTLFHKLPIMRLFAEEAEWERFQAKRARLEDWIERAILPGSGDGVRADFGAVVWRGGGRLDARKFLERSRQLFDEEGVFGEVDQDVLAADPDSQVTVFCCGAGGLGTEGPFDFLPHRRAKGEMLTVRIQGFPEHQVVSRKRWLIPIGDECFRVGATYEWDDLSDNPTEEGRAALEELVRSFTELPYTVLDHVAGVRPIVRASQPVIGRHPQKPEIAIFNGLGSKGVLYGPGVASELVDHLCEGTPIDEDLDVAALAP